MASQALGQGYEDSGPGKTAFSGVAEALINFGSRRGAFKQDMAKSAMDHELNWRRESDADSRTTAENDKSRAHQSSENAADRSHAANLEAARLKAQQVLEGAQQVHATGMQNALLSHEGTQNALGRIYDTMSRNAGFQQDAAMSQQQHQQAKDVANQAHGHRTAEASHQAGIVEHLSSVPRNGGSYSATNTGVTMSSDDNYRTPEENKKAEGSRKRQAGTPVAPAPTSESVAETPAKPEVAPVAPAQAPEAPSAPVTSSGKKNGSVAEARAKQNGFGVPKL